MNDHPHRSACSNCVDLQKKLTDVEAKYKRFYDRVFTEEKKLPKAKFYNWSRFALYALFVCLSIAVTISFCIWAYYEPVANHWKAFAIAFVIPLGLACLFSSGLLLWGHLEDWDDRIKAAKPTPQVVK